MTEWPPRDAAEFKEWLLDELPILKERREMLEHRVATAEQVMRSPQWSQIQIARTTTSDPTFNLAARWVEELPILRFEIAAIDAILDEYRRAKVALTDRQRKIIESLYEYYLGPTEVCVGLSISRSTYDRDHHDALALMVSILEWRREA